ncbi:MAG TPA: hypothetical protein VN764_17810, partial [Polyangiaceae bacterium]|nr:hypothetical protein [Polyangiaceae bacterium]
EQRLALVAEAIAEQRKRGTVGATLRALTKAGGPEAFIQAANDVLYTDGTWYTDGTFDTCSTKGSYWLVLVGASLFPQADLDRYVAIAQEWMRGTAHMFSLYQIPSSEEFGVLVEYERLD